MFAAEEELQNLVTPDAESEDPQEARLTARQVRQHAAVCLPRPPMRFLPSYTHQKKRQLSPRTALYPDAERLSLQSLQHGGAASPRASDPIQSWLAEYPLWLFAPTYPPSSVVGEAERLSVQSAPYTTWWRLLAAQLVFSTMRERTGAHASGPIRGMVLRCQ
jgi:hypothetical protein